MKNKKNKTKKEQRNYKNKKRNTISGILSVTKYGYGFVDTDDKNGFFVSEKNMGGAFSGDYVIAEPFHGKKRREYRIIKIVERGVFEVTGEYRRYDNQSFLVPLSKKINAVFKIKHVDKNITEMMNEGDIIVGEILSYGDRSKYPTVYINEYLGNKNKKGNDISVVLRQYGIKENFGEEVLNQPVSTVITENDLKGREDFTNVTVVTIDGEDAKDLDDAISVVRNSDGYVLGVHIADVSHYVRAKTPIDREAYLRGTSVYLPDRVCPMLPEKLSNGVCSLNPHELKLTFSCVMNIDNNGKITDYRIVKSYIRSDARLTYNLVKNIIEGDLDEETEKYEKFYPVINLMHELYTIMRKRRRTKGFTEFDFPETKFKLSEDGKPVDVFAYRNSFANEIIEEFMLAANTSVADFAMKHDFPFVYRVHPEPDTEKVKKLYGVLDVLGIKHKNAKRLSPSDLNEILNEAEKTQYSKTVMQIALRTMQKAVYSNTPTGHYGLNFKKYCHFTSPIRRYPDLTIHRILSEYLEEHNVKKYFKSVYDISEQSTQTEINAFMAERDCDDIKKAEYMSERIGECFEGVISGMCETGFFVELMNTVEGYVSLESLHDDYYEYFEESFMIRGKKRKNTFIIGEAVKVRVESCSISEGKIDFSLVL